MVDKQTFQGTVAQANENGFKLEGWGDVWINFSKPEWFQGIRPVQAGWVIEVTASESAGRWYASQVLAANGAPAPTPAWATAGPPAPAPAVRPMPTADPAPAPLASPAAAIAALATAPPPYEPPAKPSYQAYRASAAPPQETPQAEKAAPDPGSFPYKDGIAIPKAVALGRAVEAMAYMAAFDDLSKLSQAVLWLAQEFYDDFMAVGAEAPRLSETEQAPPQASDPGPGGP